MQKHLAPPAGMPPHRSLASDIGREIPALIALAIPVVAGLFGATSLSPVDSVMLGSHGAVPLAAASLTQSVLLIFYSGVYGLAGPVSLLAGQAHGAADPRRAAGILRHGLIIGLAGGGLSALVMASILLILPATGQPAAVMAVIGPYWMAMSLLLVPFTLTIVMKQFLDSIGRPWTGAGLMLVPLAVHVPLSWMLVNGHFGFSTMGLLGAGLSELCATLAGLAAMLVYLRFAPAMAPYRAPVPLNMRGVSEQTREGFPMALQYLLEGGSVTVAGVMIGWFGATALAANQIVFSVGGVIYMAPLGIAGAVSIRIAQALGEGARDRVRAIGLAGLTIAAVWTAAFTLVMVLAGRVMAQAFVDDPEIIVVATALFVVFGLMQMFDAVQSVSLGALRGLLDNQWPTRVSLIAYWLVALPVGALLGFGFGWGAVGLWAGFGFGLATAGAALLWRFLAKTAAAS